MTCAIPLHAQSVDLETGRNFFFKNEIERAIPFLKTSAYVNSEGEGYMLLALSYMQNAQDEDALKVCEEGFRKSGDKKESLAFIAGNLCFAKEDFRSSEMWFSEAIKVDSSYSEAFLNRANARLKLEHFVDAKSDYETYLSLEPESSQKETIIQLLSKINEMILALEKSDIEEWLKEEEEKLSAMQDIESDGLSEEERWLLEEEEKLNAMREVGSEDISEEEKWRREEEEKLSAMREENPFDSVSDEDRWRTEEESRLSEMKDETLPKELTEDEKWLLEEEEKIAAMERAERALRQENESWADEEWLKKEEEKIAAMEKAEDGIFSGAESLQADLKGEEVEPMEPTPLWEPASQMEPAP